MFFILSKILLFLINPFYWVLFCVAMYFYTKKEKTKKFFKYFGLFVLLFFSNYKIYSICVLAWQPKAELQVHNKQYQLGILLGGMTGADKYGQHFFMPTCDRFIQTCRLYHTGTIKQILISGGDGSLLQNKPKEANFLYKEFPAQAIPDSVLLVEKMSKNTYESAVEAKKMLDSLKISPPYLLITSAIHMPRSLAAFRKAGLNVEPHTADFAVTNYNVTWDNYIIPKIGVLGEWKYLLKEIVGYYVYRFTGKA